MTDLTGSALADALRDRYVFERELRVGDMAVVWLAWDETAPQRLGRRACV